MERKVINAMIYHQPYGEKEIAEVTSIYPDDADFINQNNIDVSMEELEHDYVIYFDYGKRDEEGEPIEHVELSSGKSCEDTIKSGVEKLKKIL